MAVQPYGKVPISLLECRSLTPIARLVAAWIISKPEGWEIHPPVIQAALGISEEKWLSARKSMQEAGIFEQTKKQKPDGKFEWVSKLNLSPIFPAIPKFSGHGKPLDIERRVNKQRNKGLISSTNIERRTFPRRHKNLDAIKKLHIGHVLDALEIDWNEEGGYIYWEDHIRARQAENGHWLWLEVEGCGEQIGSGSAIDLVMCHTNCSQTDAIEFLDRLRQAT